MSRRVWIAFPVDLPLRNPSLAGWRICFSWKILLRRLARILAGSLDKVFWRAIGRRLSGRLLFCFFHNAFPIECLQTSNAPLVSKIAFAMAVTTWSASVLFMGELRTEILRRRGESLSGPGAVVFLVFLSCSMISCSVRGAVRLSY